MKLLNIVTISERGELVIPQRIRERLDLQKGTKLFIEFSEPEKIITLRPVEGVENGALRGILKRTPVLRMLEAEHKKELARDARRTGRKG
jgi:AbrB family looped-hinge helix DNA binding protein